MNTVGHALGHTLWWLFPYVLIALTLMSPVLVLIAVLLFRKGCLVYDRRLEEASASADTQPVPTAGSRG